MHLPGIFFVLLGFSSLCALPAGANIFDQYLQYVEREFDGLPKHGRIDVVERGVDLSRLSRLEMLDEQTFPEIHSSSSRGEKTNILHVAISLGRSEVVRKFLSVVSDPNSERLFSWLHCPYSLAHTALDPRLLIPDVQSLPIQRLEIVDMLAEKGADFNKIIYLNSLHVANPPLAAGMFHGTPMMEMAMPLRARGMIYGADPAIVGTGFSGFKGEFLRSKKLRGLCLTYYMERLRDGCGAVSPTAFVKEQIIKSAAENKINLNTYKNLIEIRDKNIRALAQSDKFISQTRNRTTGKTGKRLSHLIDLRDETEMEFKNNNRNISRMLKRIYNKI